MKKIYLLLLTSILVSFATVTNAQFLGPLDPDTVSYVEVDFEGFASAIDGDLAGAILITGISGDDFGIDPEAAYRWCFEISAMYTLFDGIDQIEPKEGSYDATFYLGEATPIQFLELLFGLGSAPSGTAADLIAGYNSVPGLADISWPSFLGLAPGDILYELFGDEDGLYVAFGSESLDPDIFLELEFEGAARLSAKSLQGGVIPEPSTYGIIGAGFLVIIIAIRRKGRLSRL